LGGEVGTITGTSTRADTHEQLISGAGWSKLDFAERDKLNLLRLSLARNLEKLVMALYGTEWRVPASASGIGSGITFETREISNLKSALAAYQ
jgi:hypothetical protein